MDINQPMTDNAANLQKLQVNGSQPIVQLLFG
ncbi:MAG: hypothetical protein JWQ84_144 [Mucilaginibacter sp.]|jgi:hypothetical protein|nr:hypothetical protein [Mucilaginibacter sp.]MDB5139555.1 hypothetical protein [Mucilaginibacter sp.]